MKTILALGAHYDDIEIGIAGTLLFHAKKDRIFIGITNSDEDKTGDPTVRYFEQLKSLELLGIPENNLITFVTKIDSDIIGVLDGIKPDIVYAPYEEDTHQDHRRCSQIAQSVGRKLYVSTIFYAGGSTRNFNPVMFSPINFEKKSEILNCFESQKKCGALNIDKIKRREYYWGAMISERIDCYAEGLIPMRMIYEI